MTTEDERECVGTVSLELAVGDTVYLPLDGLAKWRDDDGEGVLDKVDRFQKSRPAHEP